MMLEIMLEICKCLARNAARNLQLLGPNAWPEICTCLARMLGPKFPPAWPEIFGPKFSLGFTWFFQNYHPITPTSCPILPLHGTRNCNRIHPKTDPHHSRNRPQYNFGAISGQALKFRRDFGPAPKTFGQRLRAEVF